jgi:UDPglucose--hexose-1-phosphate uridylyltransferase
MAMAELRRDPISGRWVIIAAERAKRPRQLGAANDPTPAEPCPFCAGNEALTPPEVWAARAANSEAGQPGWRVRVVTNKYPALVCDQQSNFGGDDFYQTQAGQGVHEVIVECPDHVTNMAELDEDHVTDILRAYRERLGALRRDPRWRYLLVYKNQGDRAGATFEHLHSQLVALPNVPREARDELAGAQAHFAATGRCIYCEIIERELADGRRVLFDHDDFIAFCPFASRFAYETWILPSDHRAIFEASSATELSQCARALREVIRRLNRALDNPPFNYFIHSLPADGSAPESYHWHLEILPQLSRAAGFELGTGSNINGVAPEAAAKLLRDGFGY